MISLLQRAVATQMSKILGDETALEEYKHPSGDKGLFGPQSVVWRVHSDLPSMLIGGISSLMLQSLHPLPMKAVAEHSSYKEDPLGRFQRTAEFVSGTTFGSAQMAYRLIDKVRFIHDNISGESQEYGTYRASDPDLLTFVHIAEVSSFLRSYQRFSLNPLSKEETDLYYQEVSLVAELLGARNVPKSLQGVKTYFQSIRSDLSATDEAREAFDFLRKDLPARLAGETDSHEARTRNDTGAQFTYLSSQIFIEAAYDLLFYWAKDLFKVKRKTAPLFSVPLTLLACHGLRSVVGPSKVKSISLRRATAL
jgi:uncharacterized protein (DUF2236 family)